MIDEHSPIPYHLQIKELLKSEIIEDYYDEKIPSERELMERFSVSRTTIRESVNHLVNEGILEKVHGKGTFITKTKPIQEWLHTLNSLTDTVKRMGMIPGSKLLDSKHVTNPTYIKGDLEEKFHMIKRLRTADGDPIAIERHYFDLELGHELNKYDLDSITIYDIIEKKLEIEMYEADQSITCKKVLDEDAEHLKIEKGTNVLMVDRIIRNAKSEVIEYYTSVVKPGMYEFKVKMKRK